MSEKSVEENVSDICALIKKRRKELMRAEAAIGKKKNAAEKLKVAIKELEVSLKKINKNPSKGFESLVGKWYLNTANSNKTSKDYVFVREDLGYVTTQGWHTVYRKLLLDVLNIEKVTNGSEKHTSISFQSYKGYSYFDNPNCLKPVKAEEIEEEIRKQYIRFANKTEDHGLNLYWDFSRRTK